MAVPILVIGEDPALLAVMQSALSDSGYDASVRQAGDLACWWEQEQDPVPSALVLDVPPERPALALYALDLIAAHPRWRQVPRVICCDVAFLEECARRHDAQSRLLLDPITLDELIAALVALAPARDGVAAETSDEAW